LTDAFDTPKVARGTLYFAGEKIANRMMALGFSAAIARILTQADIGLYSLLTFATSAFAAFTYLAIHMASTKFVSDAIGRQDYSAAGAAAKGGRRLLLLVSLPSLALGVIVSPWVAGLGLASEEHGLLVALAFTSAFFLNIAMLLYGEMLGLGMFLRAAMANLIHGTSHYGIGLLFAILGFGVLGLVSGWIVAGMIVVLASLWFLKGKLKSDHIMSSKTILSFSAPVAIAGILNLFHNWADVTLLYTLTGNLETTGVYFLMVSGATILSFIWVSIGRVTFPLISASYAKTGKAGLTEPIRIASRLLNIFVIPLGVSLAAVAPTAIEALFGKSYLSGSISLSILAATSILPAYSTLQMDVMKGIGYTKHFLSIGVTALLVDVVVVTILAGPLGTIGGAIARVFLWGTSVIIGYWVLRKKVKMPFGEGLFRSLMLAIVMGLSLVLTDQFFLIPYSQPLQVRILTDLVVFGLVGIVAGRGRGVFKHRDFELMKQALPSRLAGAVDRVSRLLIWEH